jgi:hypothetical protein
MPKLTIKWHTHPELRVHKLPCDICDSLDGVEWTFHTDKDPFPNVLIHPVVGKVWDTQADESRAHGDAVYNCHCTLTWTMIDFDLTETIKKLRRRVEKLNLELAKHG